MKKYVCIFCGAHAGFLPDIQAQVKTLCEYLIAMDYHLVYGGGNAGLMKHVADIFLKNGREVIGVRPNRLIEHEDSHPSLTSLVVVDNMFERKAKMMALSDVFITLPGGLGTLDELLEVYTHVKIGFVDKRCLLFNVNGYYNQLLELLDTMVLQGFLSRKDKNLLIVSESPLSLMNEIGRPPDCKLIDKVAYVKLDKGRILSSRSKGKTKYYIPGGKREGNETNLQTLQREIAEELNVELIGETVKYLGTFAAQADGETEGVLVRMACYGGEYAGKLTASHEIEEIAWLNYNDMDSVSPVDKIIFEYLQDRKMLI